MPFLYRTAMIVSRREPYVEWANSLREGDDDGFPEELARTRDVYLGPYSELQQTLDEAVADVWPEIFEEELFAWSTDESRWPANRTRDMFDEWFATELVDSIVDLVPEDPLTEDDMDVVDVQETMSRCAWCGAELGEDQGRIVPFGVSARDRFEHREGRVLSLLVRRDRVVTGVVTPRDASPSAEGADVIFRACGRACEKRLEKEVPHALRELEERLQARESSGR